MIDLARAHAVLSLFQSLRLLTAKEVAGVLWVLDPAFPFASALERAETVHVHGRVDDVASMPHEAIRGGGGVVENQRDGYVKYAFPGGLNMIWSAIDVAQDDLLKGAPRRARPHLDHVGLDLRDASPETRSLFDAAPARAAALGWRHVAQGDDATPVFCCHTSVGRKHWLYPTGDAALLRPIELAYGPLRIHPGKTGCDLRPIDPAHALAAQAVCCAVASHRKHGAID